VAEPNGEALSSAEETEHEPGSDVEVNQPGLGELRTAARNAQRRLSGGASLRADAVAGLSLAIANIPDGMANAVLVGVNPLYGLYATMIGPLVGGVFSSSQLMVITTTAAASLTTAQALGPVPREAYTGTLFLMVILVGGFQMLFGALRLGKLTRLVSYSVTTGFLAGISALLILSQIPTITGYPATGRTKVAQAWDVLTHLGQIDTSALAIGALTLLLAVVLPRTPLRNTGRLVAIASASALVALLGIDSVQVVSDVGEIAGGIPTPSLPPLANVLTAITGALSVTIVTLVQGVGVSQSVPNRGGPRNRVSRDFIAQGAANAASGLFRGLPVGGSLSATAINVISGAITRWASIFGGLWMAAIVITVPHLVSFIAMPALGALLIIAGLGSLKPSEIGALRNAGWPSLLAGGTTFLATLFLPIQAAVGLGVVLSALLFLTRSSTEVTVVALVRRPDGRIEERTPPRDLPSRQSTVLDVYGHLFYAGARTFERLLPSPRRSDHPAVILRLRGRRTLGATLIDVLASYANALANVDGRLYLTGVSPEAYRQVEHSGKLKISRLVRAHEATAIIWESTRAARADADAWLAALPETAAFPAPPRPADPGGAPRD
jgi:SulP family sulfate permease